MTTIMAMIVASIITSVAMPMLFSRAIVVPVETCWRDTARRNYLGPFAAPHRPQFSDVSPPQLRMRMRGRPGWLPGKSADVR